LGSSLPPFLLYGPPTLVFWFLYLPRCLNRYIVCTVHYSIWGASVPPSCIGLYILRRTEWLTSTHSVMWHFLCFLIKFQCVFLWVTVTHITDQCEGHIFKRHKNSQMMALKKCRNM
jgi:hypothetical protein